MYANNITLTVLLIDPTELSDTFRLSSVFSVLQVNPSIIRQWLRSGDLDKLESVVLEGQGHKLVGEYSPDPKVRAYLKMVPALMVSIRRRGGKRLHALSDLRNSWTREVSISFRACLLPRKMFIVQIGMEDR
jgi:hypothetical protein